MIYLILMRPSSGPKVKGQGHKCIIVSANHKYLQLVPYTVFFKPCLDKIKLK